MQKESSHPQTIEHGEQTHPGVSHFVRAASPAMSALEAGVENVAASSVPVLIMGENGTGKRTLAFQIHQLSPRLGESFREASCLVLGPEVFASSSSGANGDAARESLLSGGTLFLGEIGDLSSACQARLLQALSEGDGASQPQSARTRLIASSARNLEEEVRAGRFREDLYYRISGVCLRVPPLRHRKQDIPVLADYFLETYADLFGRPKPALSAQAVRFFLEYAWPGNVRELENAAKTIVALGDERVAVAALRSSVLEAGRRKGPSEVPSLKQAARAASRQAERELILKVLSRTRWNRKRAAQELQISYKALLYKLKQIGLDESTTSPQGEGL